MTERGVQRPPDRPPQPVQLRTAQRRTDGKGRPVDCRDSDRAVSDVVGFILMFGVIIVSVGVVSAGGLGDVIEFGDREELKTSERGMTAAAATLENINQQSDRNRRFELVLGTGNLWVNETSMTFDGSDDLDQIGTAGTVQLNALEQRYDRTPEDVSVSYEGGGVYRTDFITARHEPAISCDGDSAIVSLVNVTTDETVDIAIDYRDPVTLDPTDVPTDVPVADFASTVAFQADYVETERVVTDGELEIDVSETANPTQWKETLTRNGWEVDEGTGRLTCGDDLDTVLVRVTTVELSRQGF